MRICDWCGKEYDPAEEEGEFSSIALSVLSYQCVEKNLCGKCAAEAIDDEVEGVYFERCEECEKKFDYIVEMSDFRNSFDWYNGTDLSDHWSFTGKILCCDCALESIE